MTKPNVKITVHFCFHRKYTARENEQKEKETFSRHANFSTKVGL